MSRPIAAGCLLATALIAPSMARAQDETPAQMAASAGCTGVDTCLAVATARHIDPDRRYWAKRFLDAHPTPDVVAAFAKLAGADLFKLRAVAWWYASSHPEEFAPHVAQLSEALAVDPDNTFWFAEIGGNDAWMHLRTLALSLSDPGPAASGLKRADSARALDLGFGIISGEITGVKSPDDAIAALFAWRNESATWPVTEQRLARIIAGDGPTESRRLAVVALAAGLGAFRAPDIVVKAYPNAGEALQRQMRLSFKHGVGSATERAGDFPGLLRENPRDALLWAEVSGPAAAASAPDVAAFLDDRRSELRLFAQSALFAINPAAWRRELPRLAASPDIEVVLTAREIAEQDGPATYAQALAAGRAYWYPQLEAAWKARRASRARAQAEAAEYDAALARDEKDADHDEEEEALPLEAIEMLTFVVYAQACPADTDDRAHAADTLMTPEATLATAATQADVDSGHLGAALRFGGGWLTGGSRRQHEGALLFTPDDRPGYQLATSIGSEPRLMYTRDDAAFAVIGGNWVADGFSAELLRIAPVDGVMQTTTQLQLPAPPLDALYRNGRVLLHLERNGWVDVTDPQAPQWLGCGETPPTASTESAAPS